MLVYLAKGISSFFISRGIVKEEQREVYDYCFEIMLSTIFNISTVLIISLATKTFLETMCFIAGFMVVRSTAGGYHAQTHWGCWLLLVCSYITYLISTHIIAESYQRIGTILCAVLSFILILIFSPVEDPNKPFTPLEYKLFKKKSSMTAIVLAAICILISTQMDKGKMGFSVAAGMLVVSLSLIAGTLKNKKAVGCSEQTIT